MFGRKTRQRKDLNRILAGIRDARNARPSDVPSDHCAAPYAADCHVEGLHVWPCTYSPKPGWPTKFGHENTVMGGFHEEELPRYFPSADPVLTVALDARARAAAEELADEYSDPADNYRGTALFSHLPRETRESYAEANGVCRFDGMPLCECC